MMKSQIGFLALLLLAATASAQQSEDSRVKSARLRAKLELLQLDHEVDKSTLKESLSLLKRAQREQRLDSKASAEDRKRQRSELNELESYVEEQKRLFVQQAVDLERMRRELEESSGGVRAARVETRKERGLSALKDAREILEALDRAAERAFKLVPNGDE